MIIKIHEIVHSKFEKSYFIIIEFNQELITLFIDVVNWNCGHFMDPHFINRNPKHHTHRTRWVGGQNNY